MLWSTRDGCCGPPRREIMIVGFDLLFALYLQSRYRKEVCSQDAGRMDAVVH